MTDVWWWQNKWWEDIENRKVTGPEHKTNTYPSRKNCRTSRVSTELLESKHTAAILIKSGIDWCMMKSKQVVRRHRKKKNGKHKHRRRPTSFGKKITAFLTMLAATPILTLFSCQAFNSLQADIRFMYGMNYRHGTGLLSSWLFVVIGGFSRHPNCRQRRYYCYESVTHLSVVWSRITNPLSVKTNQNGTSINRKTIL